MRHLLSLTISLIFVLALPSGVFSEDSSFVKAFVEAYEEKNQEKMSAIVALYKDKVPAEIDALLKGALSPEITSEDKEAFFFTAEQIAKVYNEKFNDPSLLKVVKKKVFESWLSPPVASTPVDGVHIIEFPKATESVKNVFRPDNVIIKKGDIVRWVNNDDIAHLFSTVGFISVGGLFTPSIEPGKTFEYRLEKPGEYYYICFIHKGMIGKITVEDK